MALTSQKRQTSRTAERVNQFGALSRLFSILRMRYRVLLLGGLKFGLTFYVAVVALMYLFQDYALFRVPIYEPTRELPIGALERDIQTPDGNILKVFDFRHEEPAPYVIFFHGNAASSGHELPRAEFMHKRGFNVLLAEYRGYGGSSGNPSVQNILDDALVQFDWLKNHGAEKIFVAGHSLGTGPAIYLAANRDVAAVALEAPYSQLVKAASDRYPLLPVHTLFRNHLNPVEFIKEVEEPLLILHGTDDRTISIDLGRELYAASNKTGPFMEMIGASHHLRGYGSIPKTLEFFGQF